MNSEQLIISLQLAIDQFGKSILYDLKLINILLDLGAFKVEPSTKSVIRELISEGYMAKIVQLGNDEFKINSLVPNIVYQTGFKQDIVAFVVTCISYALGVTNVQPTFPNSNESVKNSSNVQNQDKRTEPLKGEYCEKLLTGGDLHINADRWNIRYYFSGPDGRYNGTFKTIQDNEIDNYIQAWKDNYKKYQELKVLLPSGDNSDYPGAMGMSIRFGYSEGVCLIYYHMPINNEEALKKVIKDYEYAKTKALQVQKILKGNA